MFSRIAGILVLTGTITFGFLGIVPAHATTPVSTTSGIKKVPELNPLGLASGVAVLVGGVLLLNERRRKS